MLQAWIGLVLTVAVAVTALPTALAVNAATHRSLERTAAEQAEARHRVTAVLTRDDPQDSQDAQDTTSGSRTSENAAHQAPVRYRAPDGTVRTATVGVRSDQVVGDTVHVWIDGDGDITEPPMSSDEVRSSAAGWAVLAVLAVVAGGWAAYTVAGRVLDRRRMAEWDRKWAEIAPRWSSSP